MNLKQLEAFVKVAETKSFSEAAKQLFLTQPTISAHVSALEKELNTCFLIRNTRGVELSESGKELYAYAVQMLEIEKTIKGRFGKEIKPEGNVLRIGASTVPAQYILPASTQLLFLLCLPSEVPPANLSSGISQPANLP